MATQRAKGAVQLSGDSGSVARAKGAVQVYDALPPEGVYIRRQVRTEKPDHPVDIDWNNPLAKDIQRLYLFNDGAGSTARDTVTGLNSPISRNVYSWDPDGWSQTSTAPTTNSYINTGIATPSACTIIMDVTIQSLYYYVSFFDNIGGDANHYEMWTSPSGGGHVGARTNTTDTRCGYSDGLAIGDRLTLAFSWTDGGNIHLYLRGELKDSQSSPTTGDHGTIAIAGGNDGNDGGTPLYHSFIIYDRQLSHEEVKSVSDNPYQVLQPTAQIIPFTVPVAAPTPLTVVTRGYSNDTFDSDIGQVTLRGYTAGAAVLPLNEKRMATMGHARPWQRAKYPAANKDSQWRVDVGNAYGTNLAATTLLQMTAGINTMNGGF